VSSPSNWEASIEAGLDKFDACRLAMASPNVSGARDASMHPSSQCRLFATGLGMPARCGQIVQACRRQVNARALLD
jgi:hypothetical protein